MVDFKRLEKELTRLDDLLHEARLTLKVVQSGTPLERVLRTRTILKGVIEQFDDLIIDLE